jgi:hypothetical protein
MQKKQQRAAAPAVRAEKVVAYPTLQTAEIRRLNDEFRRTLRGGRIFVTGGVSALSQGRVDTLIWRVSEFNVFDESNDPYGEHDFGSFDDGGEKFFWKIDYFDPSMSAGSPDPSDPKQTCRVLTLMFASEY